MNIIRKTLLTLSLVATALSPVAALAESGARVAILQDPHLPPVSAGPDALSQLLRSPPHAAVAGTDAIVHTLNYPYGIAVDTHSNLYVTNLFGGVNVYNAKLVKTGAITAGVNTPAAVAISFNGNIYVANNAAINGVSTITVYNPALSQIATMTDAALGNPTSMYIDKDDTAWVLDAGGTLHGYLADGAVLATTHSGGTVVGPWGPYVTVWGIANSTGSYNETYENRAQAVQSGLAFYQGFGGSPYAGGETEDRYGQQYVSDITNKQIALVSVDGLTLVPIITTPATPFGVAVDDHLQRIYVALPTLNEVCVYSLKAPYKLLSIMH
jgi:hypothetical protein